MPLRRSFEQAQADWVALLDAATQDRDIIFIERPDEEDMALIAAGELAGLLEVGHLLRSPANAERLFTALGRARRREGEPQSVDELRREVGLDDGA